MKNTLIIFMALLLSSFVSAQKYFTTAGKVHFEANVPLFEDVDATNSAVAAALNVVSGDIACVATTKNFKFKVALMEEHFNENYAESSKYPKTVFTGKIVNFKQENLSETPADYTVTGTLNFHGVKHPVTSVASLYEKNGKIYMSGKFVAKPADYDMTIPKIVTKKIAENVNVDYHFELAKK